MCIRDRFSKHLSSLIDQLRVHASQWRKIGTSLEFRQEELEDIPGRPLLLTGAPISWFTTMLSEWVEWAPGDHRKSTQYATLEALKTAVDKAGFGATALRLSLTGTPKAEATQEESKAKRPQTEETTEELPLSSTPEGEALRTSGNAVATSTEDITSKSKRRASTEETPKAKRQRTKAHPDTKPSQP